MRIYLIGMPATGKSTLGKKLALKLGYKFIDLDEYIESQAFMFIPEIFDHYGEKFFRDLETNTLKEINEDNVVISCGGGIVLKKENKKYMDGKIIYLTCPIELIEKRANESMIDRPLFKTKTPGMLYLERKAKYEDFSDIIVENIDLDLCINEILSKLGDMNE